MSPVRREHPRISRRRRAVARSRRRRIAAGTAAAGVAAGLAWGAFASPLLRVREVEVVGATHTQQPDVVEATGLDSGGNLLLLSTAAVERRAEQLPWVKEAAVDRILPGTVRIKLVERSPALVVVRAGDRFTIDERGAILTAGTAELGLPELIEIPIESSVAGGRLTSQAAQAALKVFRALPRFLRDELQRIAAPTADRVTLRLKAGTEVRYGPASRLRAKREVLQSLLGRLRLDVGAPAYIDVTVPAYPAVSPKRDGSGRAG